MPKLQISSRSKLLSMLMVVFVSFVIGLTTGYILWNVYNVDREARITKGCATTYKYVNPQPDCETLERTIGQLEVTQKKVEDLVNQYINERKASRISVWTRDLTTFRWIGVNENELFSPASLFKLPIMITYYKFAEIDPTILTQKIVDDEKTDLNDNQLLLGSKTPKLVQGQSYTVEELIEQMIIYSDNNAADLLTKRVNPDFFRKVSFDLGIKIPNRDATMDRDFLTAKSYANILRTLYNSSYISRDLSEKAISIMTKAQFPEGASAVIPSRIILAHKYGERSTYDNGVLTSRELHECGIVYGPSGPYTFCILTEGQDFGILSAIIRDISKTLYNGYTSTNIDTSN